MAESGKDRFDTLTDQELADHVASGHVDPTEGQKELDRRAKTANDGPEAAKEKTGGGSVAGTPGSGTK